MTTTRRTTRGFTLIEAIIVVAIISILAVLSLPGIRKAKTAAYETSAVKGLQTMRTTFELYYRDKGYYPAQSTAQFDILYFPDIKGYLPPEVTNNGPTDIIAKGYELRAKTDPFPGSVTDSAGRVLGSHIFTIGAFPENRELGLRTFFIGPGGTVTVNDPFDAF